MGLKCGDGAMRLGPFPVLLQGFFAGYHLIVRDQALVAVPFEPHHARDNHHRDRPHRDPLPKHVPVFHGQ